jgi:polyisoprenoid-binding protein YceI
MRGWKRWTLIAGVAAVVVVVGGLLVIHLIQGPSKKPLSLNDVPTTAASGTPTTVLATLDGPWKVVTGSTAGYRVKETLLGQSNTAVGRTTAVTGSIVLAGAKVPSASFSVDMTKVSSDRSLRDSQFQSRIMDTSQFPTATFALTSPIDLGSVPNDNVKITPKATGKLVLHGTTKTVTVSLTAQRTGNTIQVLGSIPVTFADYGISNPSGGPASVGDNGTLEFLLVLSKSA